MDPAAKRIGAVVLITVIVTLGTILYFQNNLADAPVVSQIDDVAYEIDGVASDYLNISVQFSVVIENYGQIKSVETDCENIQSFLRVKNSSTPIEELSTTTNMVDNTSYILDTNYTSTECLGDPTTMTVSENIINEIIVVIPFRFVTGDYSFIWYHSFASQFDAVVIRIDTSLGQNGVTTILEAPAEE